MAVHPLHVAQQVEMQGAGLRRVAAAGAQPVEVAATEPFPVGRVLAVVRALGVPEVVLLPNRRGGAAPPELSGAQVADPVEAVVAAARAEGRTVAVVPTRSIVQGLAALAVHDSRRSFADDLVGMASAAAATRTVELFVDTDDGLPDGATRSVRGEVDGVVAVRGTDPFAVASELLDRVVLAGGDLVTLVTGAGAEELGVRLRAYLLERRPSLEVQDHRGGQLSPLLVAGVE
jgi:dihydroxyacetone kinase-like predicted kinase